MQPNEVLESLGQSMLVDGLPVVIDLEKSHGSVLVDARDGGEYLDLHGCFATSALGWNHPALRSPEFVQKVARAVANHPTNSDFYTVEMAEYVETLRTTAQPGELPHTFLIAGGGLGVENTLKAAMDWKVRKNLAAGKGEKGTKILYFKDAFHGRTGYTLTLTNTASTVKTDYFAKFTDWPRVDNPVVRFPVDDAETARVAEAEAATVQQIEAAVAANPDEIAGLIIEPIQAEGGDNHFRPEFFQTLRRLADQHEFLLIFDEVQAGTGTTGKWWAYQHYGVQPDLIAFGKKMTVCGMLAGTRLEEVDHVFKVSGRINSTWGGSLADMVRASAILRTIQNDRLLDNAVARGEQIQAALRGMGDFVTNVRGKGLMVAADVPTGDDRNALQAEGLKNGLLLLGCGERTVRFRPALTITAAEVDRGLGILGKLVAARS
jgi:L-lysine 6-transaminase